MSSDNSDNEEETQVSVQGVSGCVILINCYDPGSYNTASVSYKATCEWIRRKFRNSNSSLFGLCFYGTKESSTGTSLDIKSLVQIQSLRVPTLEDFKNILSLNVSDFGQTSDFKLSDTLWHCSKMFKQCTKHLSERTVLMFTRLDVPPTNLDSKISHQTLNRVADLMNLGIKLKIINVSENDYKPHELYTEILKIANFNIDIYPKPVWQIEDIQLMMQQHTHRHVPLSVLDFEIGNNISIGAGIYKLNYKCSKPKTIRLCPKTNEVLATTNKVLKIQTDPDVIDDFTQNIETPLLKSETLYSQNFGGERIEFTHNELEHVNHPFPPKMMKLLGFKPKAILSKEKLFLKQCHFLFPNEHLIEGSTVAFKALHQACEETKMLPICVLCSRTNSKPKIVALNPTSMPLGLNIDIGFDVIFLPFLENIKDIPDIEDEQEMRVDDAQKIIMKSIMKDLKFNFTPDTFENPILQSLYRAIEALALEEEDVESFVDTTIPDPTQLQNIDAKMFEEIFGPFGFVAPKRSADNATAGGPSAKRPNIEPIDEKLLEERLNMQQISKYTVPELKNILQSKKSKDFPPLTGKKKAELVDLVYLHLGINH